MVDFDYDKTGQMLGEDRGYVRTVEKAKDGLREQYAVTKTRGMRSKLDIQGYRVF